MHPAFFRFSKIFPGHSVLCQPGIMIAHAALPRLIAEIPRQNAVFQRAADSFDRRAVIRQRHKAGRGAHHDHQLTRLCHANRRNARMRIQNTHAYRQALGQIQPFRHLVRYRRCHADQLLNRRFYLFMHHAGKVRMHRCKIILRRKARVLVPQKLIACRAIGANQLARQLERYPVQRLNPFVHGCIYLRRFFHYFQQLWQRPFAGHLPAVVFKPGLISLLGYTRHAVCLLLRAVMLPQLYIGMLLMLKTFHKAQRRALCIHRHYRAGCKVKPQSNDIFFINASFFNHLRQGIFQHFDIIRRMLQRPVGRKQRSVRQAAVHHRMRIFIYSARQLSAILYIHHYRTAGQRAIIQTDYIFAHRDTPFRL